MSSAPTAEEIARDARWLAQALDPASGQVRFVAMDRASYSAASFLDDRLMQQPVDAQIISWPEVEAAVAGNLRADARWIFHIGHVGSTLLSRLLGEIKGVLAIREPRILRDVAVTPAELRQPYVGALPKLMSRTFASDEISCVKATSFANEIAPDLITPDGRALFMYAAPRNYVASILAGESSVRELRALETFRSERLAKRDIKLPPPRNDADRAAAAWACEMAAAQSAADRIAESQATWADFDRMLGDLISELGRVAAFFGFDASVDEISAIANGPIMRRYSKDTSYEYSPTLRQQLIEQEVRLQGRQIDSAIAMIEAASDSSPLLARALRRAEGV